MSHLLFVNKNPVDILPFIPFVEHLGTQVSTAQNLQEAATFLQDNKKIDFIVADSELTDGKSTHLLSLKNLNPNVKFFLLSNEKDQAILTQKLQTEVEEVLIKPLTTNKLADILAVSPVEKNVRNCQQSTPLFKKLVGNSPAMHTVYYLMQRVAKTSANVFIIGESGTGKELVAQEIHENSLRADKPFIAINCGAIAPELIASTLFGHEKGSFTGATHNHIGYFEQASGGTLFLDEITETPQDFQIQLLRVLETGIIMPVGGKRSVKVDVRIIASTNRLPEQAVQAGVLRKDLYHRLNVFPIHTPTLNQRREDIGLLAHHFLNLLNQKENKAIKFSAAALAALENYPYSGNVRELKNIVQRAYILTEGEEIKADYLFASASDNHLTPNVDANIFTIPADSSLAEVKKQYIEFTLKNCNNDELKAAKSLDISHAQLIARLLALRD